MPEPSKCPFCGFKLTTPTCLSCAEVFYPILANLVKKQTNKVPALSDIDNLVFQGGGVKGVAYLGVLDQLGDEFLSKVKRIAGTSAGSMCALYLGLGKDKDEFRELIYKKKYTDLLDEGETITISWFSWGFHTRHFTSRDIVLAALKYFTKNPEAANPVEAKEKLEKFIQYIVQYLARKIGGVLTEAVISLLMKIFNFLKKFISGWFGKLLSPGLVGNNLQQPDQPKANDMFDNIVDDIFERELSKVKEEQEKKLEDERNGLVQNGLVMGQQSVDESDDPAELENNDMVFCYALSELIWTCIVGNDKNPNETTPVGLFAATKIKKELITDAIEESLNKKLGKDAENKPNAEDITFKELYNLGFKAFYVTAFNTSTLRTEVFSVDHTPNVVVSDAVRASMSIPIFFKTVNIRERLPGNQELTARRSYSSPSDQVGLPIFYVDGGLLDNYPIWIFDDLRYCLDGQIPQWIPDRIVGVQNPKTLGFRIMGEERMDIYLNPYYSEDKVKSVAKPDSLKSYIDMLKMMFSADFKEPQENEYVKYGDIPRTIYVDNKGFSAVDFNMEDDDKDKLMDSGREAIKNYLNRAKDCFEGEIGSYKKKKRVTGEIIQNLKLATMRTILNDWYFVNDVKINEQPSLNQDQ